MADFFSQFQVHPPQDFNLGGFQSAPTGGDPQIQNDLGLTGPYNFQQSNDPRASTLPQPYQQGPGGLIGSLPDWMQNKAPGIDRGGEILTDEQRQQRDQQLNDMFNKMGFKPQPGPYGREWTSGGPPGTLTGPGGFTSGSIGNGGGMQGGFNFGNLANGIGEIAAMSPQDRARAQMQSILAKHPGGFFGNIAKAVGSLVPPQQGQPGPIQQQINQTGFYAPPAVNMGANGPQQVPMNPSQQSGALGNPMVQMTGPDGSQQFVDPQHVPHYQGLGAQVTGQQLAGMSGSSYGQQ